MEAFRADAKKAPLMSIPFETGTEWFRSGFHYKRQADGHLGVTTNKAFSSHTIILKHIHDMVSVSHYFRSDSIGNCVILPPSEGSVVVSLRKIEEGEELVLHAPKPTESPALWKYFFPSYLSNITLATYSEKRKKYYMGLEWVLDSDAPLSQIWSIDSEHGLYDSKTFSLRKPIYFLVEMSQKAVGKVEKKDEGVILPVLGKKIIKGRPLRAGVEKLLTSILSPWAPSNPGKKRKVIVID